MYQAASFAHYRAHSGDVLSCSELASIDGFGESVAEALAPFISLESSALPGRSSGLRHRPRNSLSVNVSEKTSLADGKADAVWGWNSRYRIEASGLYDAGMAVRRGYDDSSVWPTSVAGYYMVYGRKTPWKMAIGDYALRFGQGLALWNGFSMTGVQNVQSFWKRPAGLSPSRALSPSSRLRGHSRGSGYRQVRLDRFFSVRVAGGTGFFRCFWEEPGLGCAFRRQCGLAFQSRPGLGYCFLQDRKNAGQDHRKRVRHREISFSVSFQSLCRCTVLSEGN